ncbi:MAG: T9SS type A sorting domain-containing protein, partial [candidate division WOR-3 bacterium]
ITCSPVSGGLVFNSKAELGIRIYSADGRLAYSGNLEKGQNRISLGPGVYLWRAGQYRGKAVVR